MSINVLQAIKIITQETGYPPTADELAAATGLTVRSVHSSLLGLKRTGVVRYDEDGERLLVASDHE